MQPIINLIFQIGIIELFAIFFALANVFTFLLYVIDKRKAVKNRWRISEKVLIFFTLALGGIGAVLGMRVARHKTKSMKFRVFGAIGLIIALIPITHIAHSFTLDRIIRYVEIEFRSERWNPELNGYRIAFMTDMHTISDEDMRTVAEELSTRNIDLLLLGGDFAAAIFDRYHFEGTVREISQTDTTDGIFGVYGNHDTRRLLFAAKERYGITPLDNDGVRIQDGFYLAGVSDLWTGIPNVAEAIAGASADDFVLLLSHNPDIAMRESTIGIDLMFSGHTHDGQITFFGFPMYLLRGTITRYGTRFAYGFAYSADGVPVFTSRGIGPYYGIPRIMSRPEVVIFTMYAE